MCMVFLRCVSSSLLVELYSALLFFAVYQFFESSTFLVLLRIRVSLTLISPSSHFISLDIVEPVKMDMSQETSLRLFEEGANFLFLDVPPGTEVGIDMQSWNTGDKFKGIKMIPPGLHFVYFSAVNKEGNTAPRTGFFHNFEKKELLVKRYDPLKEDISLQEFSEEEINRFKSNLKQLDQHLGAYPYDLWRKWVSLTNRISPEMVKYLSPTSGRILSAPELVWDQDQSTPVPDHKLTKLEEAEAKLPKMSEEPSCKINYSILPTKQYPDGSTPAEITRHSMDSTFKFDVLLTNYAKQSDFLAEVQFAFINFLVGQNYTSFEQWKSLVQLATHSEAAILKYQTLYWDFVSDLYFQISNVDADMFTDIVTSNNFIYNCIKKLYQNILDCNSVETRLRSKVERFCEFLGGKFGWYFETEELDEEDAPVIVNL